MKILPLAVILLFTATSFGQSLQHLFTESKKSYEIKDYAKFLQQTKTLDSLRPSHPAFTYNLAVAYAANGLKNEALAALKKAVLMDNTTEFETAAEFASLSETDSFKKLFELKNELNNTIISSEKIGSIDEKDLHPEGIAYLSKADTWLATSIRKRKIVSFDPKTGESKDWIKDNLLAVFAIKPDKEEKYLWVSTSAMPEMEGFTKDLDGKAEILKIEIASKKIVQRYKVDGKHVFGDLVLSKNGQVFITDSANPIVYTIKGDKMVPFLNLDKTAFNLQGITFNADESKLFVADYLKGILVVPIAKPQDFRWLTFPTSTSYKGIDGLVFFKNSLIAVHNGVTPIRIVRYFLNDKGEVSDYKILDHNRAEFNEPALAALKGNELFFFANSPWKAYDKNFQLNVDAFENPMFFSNTLDSK